MTFIFWSFYLAVMGSCHHLNPLTNAGSTQAPALHFPRGILVGLIIILMSRILMIKVQPQNECDAHTCAQGRPSGLRDGEHTGDVLGLSPRGGSEQTCQDSGTSGKQCDLQQAVP